MVLPFGSKTLIMGILNVTPDSFYDGGRYAAPDKALSHAYRMAQDGADIIDIGGESSRPGALPVSEQEEIDRICPVIEHLVKTVTIPLSVDSYKARVADAAVKAGATIINDISGLAWDDATAGVAARSGAYLIIMHMQGTPQTMQAHPCYDDLRGEIRRFLITASDIAVSKGVVKDKIIIDPGIGFGKTLDDNYKIINTITYFREIGYPLLVGLSRKSLIGGLGDGADDRLPGTIALNAIAAYQGADIIRVHDVREHRLALMAVDYLKRTGREPGSVRS